MGQHSKRRSDEPTRLRNLVSTIFHGGPRSVVRASSLSEASLREGVSAQDDCAVFAFSGDQELVVGSDYVRGPKFRLYEYGLLSNYDIGYYLAVANISDVAAMGARPLGLLSVVRYPPSMDDDAFRQILEGIRDGCHASGTVVVGGDIGGAERIILSATALGVCRPGGALLRRGAKPGDALCVTGATGVAGAAMEYLRSSRRSAPIDSIYRSDLLNAWRRPTSRVREGICLGDSGYVSSCQDTSDGLKATIESIADASDVGFTVDASRLEIPKSVVSVCEFLGLDVFSTIMGDSVDFQLVFTVPETHIPGLKKKFAAEGLTFSKIGAATDHRAVVLRLADGDSVPLPGEAWR